MKKRHVYFLLAALALSNEMTAQRKLTLEESKQLVLQNNYRIKNSELEVDAARQTSKAALTNYFPTISASGVAFKADDNVLELFGAGLFKKGTFGMVSAVQPVFAGGRILNGNKLASLGEEVSEHKQRLSRNEILLKTEEQYWLVVALNEKHKTVRRYEELLNSLLAQVEDAFRSGVVMKNDVLKVRVKHSEVLLNKSKVENGCKLATMALCQHIGIPYDSTLVLSDSLTIEGSPQSYYVDNTEVVKERSEYHLLQASVRAEELQSKMKLGEYLPQVGIGVSGLYMKIDQSKDRTMGMVFGTVSIPISGWWEASHALQERSIKEQIAQNNLQDNSELLLLQMQNAWQDFTDSYKQILLSEEAKAQAEENLKVNQDSYDNGMISVADLLEAQALDQQMNDQLTDAKANYRNKRSTYLQVTGR